MPVHTLLSTLHDFDLLECEKIVFETYSKHLKLIGTNDTATVEIILEEYKKEGISVTLTDEVYLTISLEEINSFIKNILRMKCETFHVRISNERPLNLAIQVCEHFTIQYYLAPKEVDEDDGPPPKPMSLESSKDADDDSEATEEESEEETDDESEEDDMEIDDS